MTANPLTRRPGRQRNPPPEVVVLPRVSAVVSMADLAKRSQRGRIAWQKATSYGRRALIETAVGRYKHLIGQKLQPPRLPSQQVEAALAVHVLNRKTRAAKPVSDRVA